MPKLILIHGPIASGKSTLSKALLNELKRFAFVDRAYMKRMLKPIGKPEAKAITNKAIKLIVAELMKLKKDILVQEQSRTSLKTVISKYGKSYKIYSFFLKCDLKKSIDRDKLREKSSSDVKQISSMYERIQPEPKDIIIDTGNNSIDKCIKLILKT
jgi:adenylylsulfate kinase-like enzyme